MTQAKIDILPEFEKDKYVVVQNFNHDFEITLKTSYHPGEALSKID